MKSVIIMVTHFNDHHKKPGEYDNDQFDQFEVDYNLTKLLDVKFIIMVGTHLVSMTMVEDLCSHTILQKSARVSGRGP